MEECQVKFHEGRSHLRSLEGWVCGVWACGDEATNIGEKKA